MILLIKKRATDKSRTRKIEVLCNTGKIAGSHSGDGGSGKNNMKMHEIRICGYQ